MNLPKSGKLFSEISFLYPSFGTCCDDLQVRFKFEKHISWMVNTLYVVNKDTF